MLPVSPLLIITPTPMRQHYQIIIFVVKAIFGNCHLRIKSGHPFEETILITHSKHMQDNCVMAGRAFCESRLRARFGSPLCSNGTLVGKSRYRRDGAARREQGAKQRSSLTYKKLRKLQ
jgi:hypothetical protein